MATLTKEDLKQIKGVVVEVVEPLAKAIQTDFNILKSGVGTLKSDVGDLKLSVGSTNTRLISVEKDVKWMKDNSSELFAKLDRFISLYENQKDELATISVQMGRLEERVAKLEAR